MEAPSYNWVCQVCEAPNAAGAATCAKCGFPATAKGKAIAAARSGLHPQVQTRTDPETKQKRSPLTPWQRFVVAVFGFWLAAGGFVSLTRGHWPNWMPPYLDVIAVPISFLSAGLGAVIGGFVSGALGLLLLLGAFNPPSGDT